MGGTESITAKTSPILNKILDEYKRREVRRTDDEVVRDDWRPHKYPASHGTKLIWIRYKLIGNSTEYY
jgi:hypothetical protein